MMVTMVLMVMTEVVSMMSMLRTRRKRKSKIKIHVECTIIVHDGDNTKEDGEHLPCA